MSEGEMATDGRDRRWEGHRRSRRARLLDEAVRLIDLEGPSVSVARIAKSAGIPRSVVYKLFEDRRELDRRIVDRIVTEVNALLLAKMQGTGTVEELVGRCIEAYVGWVSDHPGRQAFLTVSGSGARQGGRTALAHDVLALVSLAWNQVYDGRDLPAAAAEDLVYGAFGLVDGVLGLESGRHAGVPDLGEVSDFLTDAIVGLVASTLRRVGVELDPEATISLA